jgi:hypothetical protein
MMTRRSSVLLSKSEIISKEAYEINEEARGINEEVKKITQDIQEKTRDFLDLATLIIEDEDNPERLSQERLKQIIPLAIKALVQFQSSWVECRHKRLSLKMST